MNELDFGRGVVLSTNGRERKSSFLRSGNTLSRPRNFTERSNANPGVGKRMNAGYVAR